MSKTVNWYGDKFVRFRIVGDNVEIDLRSKILTKKLGVVSNMGESTRLHYLLGIARTMMICEMLRITESNVILKYNNLLIKIYYQNGVNVIIPEKYNYLIPLLIKLYNDIKNRDYHDLSKFPFLAAALDEILFEYI